MKYLFLLFLAVGCGHQEPETLDLQDDDGDLIANSYEAEGDRSIAQLPSLEKLEGELIVREGSEIIALAQIQNWAPNSNEALEILKGLKKTSGKEEYFKESHGLKLRFTQMPSRHIIRKTITERDSWGKPRIKIMNPEEHDDRNYSLEIKFKENSDTIAFLDLVQEGEMKNLFAGDNSDRQQITGKTLRELYQGTTFIEATRNEREREIKNYIRLRARKVYVSEGELNEVYYLARNKDLHFLKERLGIRETLHSSQSAKILEKGRDSFGVYARSNEGEDIHVIMRAKTSVVQDVYLDENNRSHFKIERHNGKRGQNFLIENDSQVEKIFILNVKPLSHRKWEFNTRNVTTYHGRERDLECTRSIREKSRETNVPLNISNLLSEMRISVNGKLGDLAAFSRFELRRDESGSQVIGLVIPPGKTQLFLGDSKLGNQNVGTYDLSYSCSGKKQTESVSIESYFGLELGGFFAE